MPLPIEDYALIGDLQTAALVGRDGSMDWLCLPRFDSGACFAALLGEPKHGRWLIAPASTVTGVRRRYRPGTLILETEFQTEAGTVRLIDFMPPRGSEPDLVRVVEGVSGRIPMRMELLLRFDYGSVVPWVRSEGGMLRALAGPDGVCLRTPVPTEGRDLTTVAEFTVSKGERVPFVLAWHASHRPPPPAIDAEAELEAAETWWREWSARCTYRGPWREAVLVSLIVLKALTYEPTGGLIAAPTTSLPEKIGSVRNWDYRYCWVRDATLALYALLLGGYTSEAQAWRDWLLRAVAGDISQLRILYGLAGERRIPEFKVPWLPGYAGSAPVRVGNAASEQLQLDVYGEIVDCAYQARRAGIPRDDWAWRMQLKLLDFLESAWKLPDYGIWEVRGDPRPFTHSKVMAWVAFDRAVKTVESSGLEGPVERWRALRDDIHAEVCRSGYDPVRNTFTQSYGREELDASLLTIPLVGFLPIGDRRVEGTIRAVERELVQDGFVLRYRTKTTGEIDGLPAGEGAFLACTFWLADDYALQGRREEAKELFERLLTIRNDVGLLAEQYDPVARRQLGNFPQAFSHLALSNTAYNLTFDEQCPKDLRRT